LRLTEKPPASARIAADLRFFPCRPPVFGLVVGPHEPETQTRWSRITERSAL